MAGHIVAFQEVDDYRFLWKKIKNPNASVYPEKTQISDDTSNFKKDKPWKDLIIYEDVTNIKSEQITEDVIEETSGNPEEGIPVEKEETETPKEVKFQLNEKNKLFLSKIDLVFEDKTTIADVLWTWIDYYDNFLIKKSDKFDIYVFWENKYEEIFSFFDVRSDETKKEINAVNNFWERSFYLNEWEVNNTVRIVLEKDYNTYWFVVSKENYPLLKEILQEL